jgi:type VI protein secretion system component Hcp
MVPVAGTPGTANLVYLQIVFTKAVISSRSLGGDDGIKQEHVNLVFQTVQFKYTQIKDGAVGSSFTKIFDAKSNRVT